MNIEIANRLAQLRKQKGYSQEQLAEKLGLSRQAVSKWERAEASPDTDNLICLARIYGVSLDDLLNTEEPIEDIVRDTRESQNPESPKPEEPKEEKPKKDSVNIGKDGVHIEDEDGTTVHIDLSGLHVHDARSGERVEVGVNGIEVPKHLHKEKSLLEEILWPTLMLGAVIGYILMGFFWNNPGGIGWAVGWTLILYAIALGSLFEAIRKKRFSSFALPVLITGVYVGLGIVSLFYAWPMPTWHPWWVLFLLIPIYYPIAGAIDKRIHRHDVSIAIHGDVIDEDDEDEEDEEDDD
ncbi:MAG: helix-turn-helix domain-containing protein [Candidatus Enteromonas sp.]|nr:helix-turn-helix domain-containing protein [Candidatus Enteromonas sp.]